MERGELAGLREPLQTAMERGAQAVVATGESLPAPLAASAGAAMMHAGVVTDAGLVTDAGVVTDAGAVARVGVVTDAGAIAHAGVVTDAGAIAAAGGVTDAGDAAVVPQRPTVLVLAGLDPSGGAGVTADVQAIAAQGAHALPVVTALTVQDNNRVYGVTPVDPDLIERQVAVLAAGVRIDAVKIGIPGSRANAEAIARVIVRLRETRPGLPVVLDPVLASGHGDALARGNAVDALRPLLALATVLVPNLNEAAALGDTPCPHVLVTGGHGEGPQVINRYRRPDGAVRSWTWERLPGEFHGSGCTLAAAIAARLALGEKLEEAFANAQGYTHASLIDSFSIAPGQRIPQRASAAGCATPIHFMKAR